MKSLSVLLIIMLSLSTAQAQQDSSGHTTVHKAETTKTNSIPLTESTPATQTNRAARPSADTIITPHHLYAGSADMGFSLFFAPDANGTQAGNTLFCLHLINGIQFSPFIAAGLGVGMETGGSSLFMIPYMPTFVFSSRGMSMFLFSISHWVTTPY